MRTIKSESYKHFDNASQHDYQSGPKQIQVILVIWCITYWGTQFHWHLKDKHSHQYIFFTFLEKKLVSTSLGLAEHLKYSLKLTFYWFHFWCFIESIGIWGFLLLFLLFIPKLVIQKLKQLLYVNSNWSWENEKLLSGPYRYGWNVDVYLFTSPIKFSIVYLNFIVTKIFAIIKLHFFWLLLFHKYCSNNPVL